MLLAVPKWWASKELFLEISLSCKSQEVFHSIDEGLEEYSQDELGSTELKCEDLDEVNNSLE